MVVKEWLQSNPKLTDLCVSFDMDSLIAMKCIQCQGTTRLNMLLALLEDMFVEEASVCR